MKKTIFSLCLAISAFCLSGCSDFLDREPYGKDATWKTKEDVDQAIYALYHFVSPYWSEEICGRGHMSARMRQRQHTDRPRPSVGR